MAALVVVVLRVERRDRGRNPIGVLLDEHDRELGVALEHLAPDQQPERSTREPPDLGPHDGADRRVARGVGRQPVDIRAAPSDVDVERQRELHTRLPDIERRRQNQ